MKPLDAAKSKPFEGAPSFSLAVRIHRLIWNVTWFLLASWTPPILHRWRRFLLKLFGAQMAEVCDVRGSARVWYPPNLIMENFTLLAEGVTCYNMGLVMVGSGTIISQRAFLCGGTHDIDDPNWQLVTKPIIIQEHCWIAAEAFIGPGVTVGRGAVLGARGVATRDLEQWTTYGGNPAKPIGRRVEIGSRSPPEA